MLYPDRKLLGLSALYSTPPAMSDLYLTPRVNLVWGVRLGEESVKNHSLALKGSAGPEQPLSCTPSWFWSLRHPCSQAWIYSSIYLISIIEHTICTRFILTTFVDWNVNYLWEHLVKGEVSELDAYRIRALVHLKMAPGPTDLLHNLGKLFHFSVTHFPNV